MKLITISLCKIIFVEMALLDVEELTSSWRYSVLTQTKNQPTTY